MTESGYRSAEIRSVAGDRRTVTARAVSYGVRDTFGTSWAPGVFKHSLSRSLPAVLWAHNRERIVGKVTDFADTPTGLDVTIRLADPARVPDAAMVQSLLADSMVPGVSVGFRDAVAARDPQSRDTMRIKSATLSELSFVAAPSVPGAVVTGWRDDAASSLRQLGLSDEEIRQALAPPSPCSCDECLGQVDAEVRDAMTRFGLSLAEIGVRLDDGPRSTVQRPRRPQPVYAKPPPGTDYGHTFNPLVGPPPDGPFVTAILPESRTLSALRALQPAPFNGERIQDAVVTVPVDKLVADEAPPDWAYTGKPVEMTNEELWQSWNARRRRQFASVPPVAATATVEEEPEPDVELAPEPVRRSWLHRR